MRRIPLTEGNALGLSSVGSLGDVIKRMKNWYDPTLISVTGWGFIARRPGEHQMAMLVVSAWLLVCGRREVSCWVAGVDGVRAPGPLTSKSAVQRTNFMNELASRLTTGLRVTRFAPPLYS